MEAVRHFYRERLQQARLYLSNGLEGQNPVTMLLHQREGPNIPGLIIIQSPDSDSSPEEDGEDTILMLEKLEELFPEYGVLFQDMVRNIEQEWPDKLQYPTSCHTNDWGADSFLDFVSYE